MGTGKGTHAASKVPAAGERSSTEASGQGRPLATVTSQGPSDGDGLHVDRNGLEMLARREALQLLSTQVIGRIAVTSGALPVILPVNFALVDDEIIIRTTRGTKLDAATRGAVVAFEVDDFNAWAHTGWSVAVTGVSREVTDPAEQAALALRHLARWAPADADRIIAISTEIVSGRRIGLRNPAILAALGRTDGSNPR